MASLPVWWQAFSQATMVGMLLEECQGIKQSGGSGTSGLSERFGDFSDQL